MERGTNTRSASRAKVVMHRWTRNGEQDRRIEDHLESTHPNNIQVWWGVLQFWRDTFGRIEMPSVGL